MNKTNSIVFSYLVLSSALFGCKSIPKNADSSVGIPTQVVVSTGKEGILLQGNDDQRAIEAIIDYSLESGSDEGESKEPTDKSPASRKISITLKNTATVGQVNSLLNRLQARIVWSAKNSPNLEILLSESKDPNHAQSTLEFLKNQKDVITFAVTVEE